MIQPKKYLAQINIAKLKAPLDHPIMKEFTDFLDPVNKLAEDSPGFVWRLKDEYGQSSVNVESPFDDKSILINMSVWEDFESLQAYTYNTVHAYFLKNRGKWMEKTSGHNVVLWWVEKDKMPSVWEAKAKLEQLEKEGPGPEAFDLKNLYDSRGDLYNRSN